MHEDTTQAAQPHQEGTTPDGRPHAVARPTASGSPRPPVVTVSSYRRRTYSIYVTTSVEETAERLLAELADSAAAIVTDRAVGTSHAQCLAGRLSKMGIFAPTFSIPVGEQSKTPETAHAILDWLAQRDFGRLDVLIAVGGGVVTDIVGWAASIYMRGVPYINVPTTLLGQVDAAIGGKVGVNHQTAKNLIGAFYEPRAVISCINYLTTLDDRHLRAGLAEVIKKAVIASPSLFELVEEQRGLLFARETAALRSVVEKSAATKCRLVERDPYETNLRRPLNFGHTIGHAVETATGYGLVTHGEAVAFGMAAAVRIAVGRRLIERSAAERIIGLLTAVGLPVVMSDLEVQPPIDDVVAPSVRSATYAAADWPSYSPPGSVRPSSRTMSPRTRSVSRSPVSAGETRGFDACRFLHSPCRHRGERAARFCAPRSLAGRRRERPHCRPATGTRWGGSRGRPYDRSRTADSGRAAE